MEESHDWLVIGVPSEGGLPIVESAGLTYAEALARMQERNIAAKGVWKHHASQDTPALREAMRRGERNLEPFFVEKIRT